MILAERTADPGPGRASPGPASRDNGGLLFTAEMYGVQLDQLAAILGVSEACAIATRWRAQMRELLTRAGDYGCPAARTRAAP